MCTFCGAGEPNAHSGVKRVRTVLLWRSDSWLGKVSAVESVQDGRCSRIVPRTGHPRARQVPPPQGQSRAGSDGVLKGNHIIIKNMTYVYIYIYVIFLSVKYVQPLTPIHFNDCDSGCLIALHFNHSNWKECLLLLAFERCQQSQQHQPLASLPIGTMADPIDSTCKSFKSLTAWCVLDLFFREKMMRSQTFSQ